MSGTAHTSAVIRFRSIVFVQVNGGVDARTRRHAREAFVDPEGQTMRMSVTIATC
jgi:hypothetical protein